MTNDDILAKAFDKAEKNGWDGFKYIPAFPKPGKTEAGLRALLRARMNDIIFSHEFAKALWADSPRMMHMTESSDVGIASATVDGGDAWKAHLQILAITPPSERLKYIERFL